LLDATEAEVELVDEGELIATERDMVLLDKN
jgi:hypothetical protein